MLRRWLFFLTLIFLPLFIWWWQKAVQPAADTVDPTQLKQRQDVVEVLDRLVNYEYYYRSVHGHFTKFLNRVGYSIPDSIREMYEIQVIDASPDELLITAFSETNGKTEDAVTIDASYRLRASFPIPAPRSEYLASHATRMLWAFKNGSISEWDEEPCVYREYFRYQVHKDAFAQSHYVAVGIRPPVLDTVVEVDGNGSVRTSLAQLPVDERQFAVGQKDVHRHVTGVGDVTLAQRIFLGETGRYAKDWAELSRITSFGQPGSEENLSHRINRDIAQQGKKPEAQFPDELIVEPISADIEK